MPPERWAVARAGSNRERLARVRLHRHHPSTVLRRSTMKIANVQGRLALVVDGGTVDVHDASSGRFDPDPAAAFERWDELREWAGTAVGAVRVLDPASLGAP